MLPRVNTCRYDLNTRYGNGVPFAELESIHPEWESFLVDAFTKTPDNGQPGTDHPNSSMDRHLMGSVVGKPKLKSRDELVDLVTDENGQIWMPKIQADEKTEAQRYVRGFLNAHYSISWTLCRYIFN